MPQTRIEIAGLGDGQALDALAASPDGAGQRPAIVLLSDRAGLGAEIGAIARRLSAHGFFVLAPDWRQRPPAERREDVDAWLDYLAAERAVDDTAVGFLGYGPGGDLALQAAAWRAERVRALATVDARGFDAEGAQDIAERLNSVVWLGCRAGVVPPRLAILEAALRRTGVDFEIEPCGPEPPWTEIVDLFSRTLFPAPEIRDLAAASGGGLNARWSD